MRVLFICLTGLAACQSPVKTQPPSPTTIHIAADAPAGVRTAAEELARWVGSNFTITTNAFEGRGFYLALAGQDKLQKTPAKLATLGPEGLYIRGSKDSVSIIGNTELAVREAMYLYLEKLGFRWYLPHPAWHIVPAQPQLFTEFELLTKPDYESRNIWSGYKTGSDQANREVLNWGQYNRLGGAFQANAGHAYPAIIQRNRAAFDAHPEYFALLADGQRDTNRVSTARKFCVTNEGLIQLCVDDALARFATDPKLQMVSLDPSDGSGSCECETCRALGTVSDRVFYLANRVAKAIGEKLPGKWVGLYAYSDHQLPTSIPLATNVYVMVATAFNSTPYSIDGLIAEWGRRVTKLGIREYYGVLSWDWDMPGRPRGARIDYLRRTIPHFHEKHANALSAETSNGWINRGLGQYIAAHLLWDTRTDVDALVNEFYDRCFGAARPPIEELFTRWQRNGNALPTGHDLAIWLRLVAEAEVLTTDAAVRERLDQIKLYLHFVAVFQDYKTAADDAIKLKMYEELLRYVWRVRDLTVCPSFAIVRVLANNAAPSAEYRFNNPNRIWRDERPVTAADTAAWFAADRARFHEIFGLQPVAPAEHYVPLGAPAAAVYNQNVLRGRHDLLVEVPPVGTGVVKVAMGFVQNRKYELPIRLYRLDQEPGDEQEKPVVEKIVTGDQAFHDIPLTGVAPGIYRLVVEDRRSGLMLQLAGLRASLIADAAHQIWSTRRSDFYFHVPKGTAKFAVVTTGPLTLQKPSGQRIKTTANQRLLEMPVADGEAGVWQVLEQAGRFYFIGIPALVGFAPDQMLIPADAK